MKYQCDWAQARKLTINFGQKWDVIVEERTGRHIFVDIDNVLNQVFNYVGSVNKSNLVFNKMSKLYFSI